MSADANPYIDSTYIIVAHSNNGGFVETDSMHITFNVM
jgi:hypothetical protein